MGADSFKPQGQVQLQLGGRRTTAPALGPQGGGVRIAPAGEASAPAAPVFNITPSAPVAPAKATAPLGGSKIPSMRTSQAGGGARDAFTPAGNGSQIRLAGQNPVQLAQTEQAPQQSQEESAPQLAGGEDVIRCEAVAEMPNGQRFVAPYDAVFPKGAKFLGVTSRAL